MTPVMISAAQPEAAETGAGSLHAGANVVEVGRATGSQAIRISDGTMDGGADPARAADEYAWPDRPWLPLSSSLRAAKP